MIDIASAMFSSEHDIDKIVRIYSGSFAYPSQTTVRAGSIFNIDVFTIAHNLGRPVACEMQWSLDGVTWIDNGSQDDSFRGSLAYSDSNNVYIISPLFTAGTVYYRVWCSWINDYDNSNPLIDVFTYSDTPLLFDSRLNLQKIYDQGVLTFSPGTFGSPEIINVPHTFNYTPNAKVWFEAFAGEVWPLNSGGSSNLFNFDGSQDECELRIDSSKIEVRYKRFSNATRRAWYKIYYDKN